MFFTIVTVILELISLYRQHQTRKLKHILKTIIFNVLITHAITVYQTLAA